jgi:hypothetical protein
MGTKLCLTSDDVQRRSLSVMADRHLRARPEDREKKAPPNRG